MPAKKKSPVKKTVKKAAVKKKTVKKSAVKKSDKKTAAKKAAPKKAPKKPAAQKKAVKKQVQPVKVEKAVMEPVLPPVPPAEKEPVKPIKRGIPCDHCDATGVCASGSPYDKSHGQMFGAKVRLTSCPECLHAAGEHSNSKKLVTCRICGGDGQV